MITRESALSRIGYQRAFDVTRTLVLALAAVALPAARIAAQDGASSFRRPVLVVETEGHHAPVRSLIWPDNTTLISAGQDKVVKVWDLTAAPKLLRTIRPPVWRGPAGILYAAALSRWPDAKGQRLLSVGGVGVDATRGDMTVYAFPGKAGAETGEPLARLIAPKDSRLPGHRSSVLTIAYDDKFMRFASAGTSTELVGSEVILWNANTFTPIRALKGHTGSIRALAFLPDGGRLVTISAQETTPQIPRPDNTLRLWNLTDGTEIGRYASPSMLNALAVSPDGTAILAGTESGKILHFDPADVRTPRSTIPTRAEQGPIECLAFKPDGRQFVSAVKTSKEDMAVADYSRVACDVELRNWPNGEIVWQRRLPGLIYAAAFRPDGQAFAYSGGIDQAIYVHDTVDQPPIKGKGTTVLNVGFTADSNSVGFSRDLAPAGQGATVDGFNFSEKRALTLPDDGLRRAIMTYDGWTFRGSINTYTPELVKGAIAHRLDLNRNSERLWWSYTFLPPGPGHARPTFAIGTEAGVVIYDLETGRRTRFFAGHASPVVSLAPSPDGRWLASGSVDQTVMLYALEGCDRGPGLGVSLRSLPDGRTVVDATEPRGFAAASGLLPGDVLRNASILRGKDSADYTGIEPLREFLKAAEASTPQLHTIVFRVRRTMPLGPLAGLVFDVPDFGTRKLNSAALTLLLDVSREWVIWTPQGYYDTSIDGDTRLLGWQINAPYTQASPNDFLPIAMYESTLRRPALLEQLWRTGDLTRALAATAPVEIPPVALTYDDRPPKIAITSPDPALPLPAPGTVWVVNVPQIRVKIDIISQGDINIRSWQALLDQRSLAKREVSVPGRSVSEELSVTLAPNRPARLALQASNARGNARTESIDLIYVPSPKSVEPPVSRAPRRVVIAIGSERTQVPFLPELSFAGADARDLGGFLATHLNGPAGEVPGVINGADTIIIPSASATTSKIRSLCEDLSIQLREKQLMPGDSVVMFLETHALESQDGLMLAMVDSAGLKAPRPVITPRELSELLGEIAEYGCRVALFLDVVHDTPEKSRGDGFKQWVRELYQQRNVITFVASKEGPSLQDKALAHGIFALGVLGAFEQAGASAGIKDRAAAYTLGQFKKAIVEAVSVKSSRRQFAECYIPRSVSQATRFAKP